MLWDVLLGGKMSVEYITVGINNIEIYEDNPRFVKAGNQREAIKRLVQDEEDKHELANLAESMLLLGQNPLESVGVIKGNQEGSYIAVEGNRRVLAAKLYFNPELGEDNQSTVNSFKNLQKKYKGSGLKMVEKLNCCLFDSLDDANPWITLKHTGQNKGAGVVSWNRIQSLRQAIRDGKKVPDKGFLLVDWLESTGHLTDVGIESYEDINNTTTLNRLLDDSSVLKEIKLCYDKEPVIESFDDDLTVRFVSRIIGDLNSGKLPVGRVYSHENRMTYINDLKNELGLLQDSINGVTENTYKGNEKFYLNADFSVSDGVDDDSMHSVNSESGKKTTPGSPNLSTRKKIIPNKDRNITGVSGKASEVLKELKKINCKDFPVAAALLIRCFYEMTAKHFIKSFNINVERKFKSHLGELFFKCKERIISNGTNEQKENAEKFLIKVDKGFHLIDQLEELNKIIHDTDVVRDKEFFFTTWDTFRPFMQDLWNLINEQNRKNK